MTTIRMTQREKELTRASEQGKRDFTFLHSASFPSEYANDPALKQAWENGYRIAKEEAIADHRIGYF